MKQLLLLWVLGLSFQANATTNNVTGNALCLTPEKIPETMISCTSSSSLSSEYTCEKAFDGLTLVPQRANAWASKHEGVGAWIEAKFTSPITVKEIKLFPRTYRTDQIKNINLVFDGNVTYEIELQLQHPKYPAWNVISFSEGITATSLRIVIRENFRNGGRCKCTGFKEIEFLGCFDAANSGTNNSTSCSYGHTSRVRRSGDSDGDGNSAADGDGDGCNVKKSPEDWKNIGKNSLYTDIIPKITAKSDRLYWINQNIKYNDLITLYDTDSKMPLFTYGKIGGKFPTINRKREYIARWTGVPALKDSLMSDDDWDIAHNENFNRGHLFPVLLTSSEEQFKACNFHSNLVAQDKETNSLSGAWTIAESEVLLETVKSLRSQSCDLYIVTGAVPGDLTFDGLGKKINIPSFMWTTLWCTVSGQSTIRHLSFIGENHPQGKVYIFNNFKTFSERLNGEYRKKGIYLTWTKKIPTSPAIAKKLNVYLHPGKKNEKIAYDGKSRLIYYFLKREKRRDVPLQIFEKIFDFMKTLREDELEKTPLSINEKVFKLAASLTGMEGHDVNKDLRSKIFRSIESLTSEELCETPNSVYRKIYDITGHDVHKDLQSKIFSAIESLTSEELCTTPNSMYRKIYEFSTELALTQDEISITSDIYVKTYVFFKKNLEQVGWESFDENKWKVARKAITDSDSPKITLVHLTE